MTTRRYFIKTYGCQMNVHDSERMAGMLEAEGYLPAESVDDADLVLLNTCSVRDKADHKLFTMLGTLKDFKEGKENPILAVAGCIAQRASEEIMARAPHVDAIIGPGSIPEFKEMISEFGQTGKRQVRIETVTEFDGYDAVVRSSPTVAFVTIMEGCNKFCSYCVVPYTRGREMSKPSGQILSEVNKAVASGYTEIQLLGQNVNAYQDKAAAMTFVDLLAKVSDIGGIERIRFITSHPRHLDEGIVKMMSERANICNAIHLPPQSGSSVVLKRMNRRYGAEDYLEKIALLRRYMPEIAISADIIVGFSGETEEDFQMTMDMLRQVHFAFLFSFAYSPRPGTKAFDFEDDVSKEIKLDRLHRLQELQAQIQKEDNQKLVGKTIPVLFDGGISRKRAELVGRSEGNFVVNVDAPKSYIGKIVNVKVTAASQYSFKGELPDA
jgi:tRNA-2-methylthio-N6-dimethylallyladenosine synthase